MKMAWYTWVIIVLVILSYFQYAYPEKSHEMLSPLHGQVQDFIEKNTFFKAEDKTSSTDDSTCPDTDNPVCGSDGITYKNMCFASEAGIYQATQGQCSV